MSRMESRLKAFNELVSLKYRLYNGLFLELPFEDLADTGVLLPLFAKACREKLAAGHSPRDIVDAFFQDHPGHGDFPEKMRVLFKFVQLVERQVVLFDALEDAAFEKVNDLNGPGTLEHLLARLDGPSDRRAFREKLDDYRIRIVLTAHPTQFYPEAILGVIADLSETIRGHHLDQINDLLLQMGKTRFRYLSRPSPLDEAKGLLWYLENVFYPTVPHLQAKLLGAWNDSLGESEENLSPSSLAPKVELGFWPGGDRDGNPSVTAETTLKVAQMLNASLLRLYLADLQALERRLTFAGTAEKLVNMRERLQECLYHALLLNHSTPPVSPYRGPDELLTDLETMRAELNLRHQGLFVESLDILIHKVNLFGFHFATLDLRQDSGVHGEALAALLPIVCRENTLPAPVKKAAENYAALSNAEKTALLETLLAAKWDAPAERPAAWENPVADTLESLRAVDKVQRQNGVKGLNRYIISHTFSAHNVLEVLALARMAGFHLDTLQLDVIPLFETIEDLRNARAIMAALYASETYRKHLGNRRNTQTIMLGFSDGTKDGGYLAANWSIYTSKVALTEISRESGITAVFFDGRGGPPARGGGNTHKFYRSLGSPIEHTEIQLTVQGQTISSNFGTPTSARFNLEQLFTAGLEPDLFPDGAADLSHNDRALLQEMSQLGGEAYAALKNHPLFLPYLEEMTPLDYFNRLNIASRPVRRATGGKRRFEDLRAIPFVGAWSQMKQNIPGFYGFGYALNRLIEAGRKDELHDLYERSLFFRTLVENAMMSLRKSFFPLTQYIEEDKRFGDFWKLIYGEATDSRDRLKEITGQKRLLENSPTVRESIRIRESIVLPILTVQQFALQEVREAAAGTAPVPGSAERERLDVLEKLIVRSMPANINASRNSA